jgi:hypothetical protein
MKPHAAFVLSVIHPAPPAPAAQSRDPETGRFVSLSGPAGYSPIGPPAPRDGAAEHNAFIAELLGPRDLGT